MLSIEGLYEQNKYLHDLIRKAVVHIVSTGFNAKMAMKGVKQYWPDEQKKLDLDHVRAVLKRDRDVENAKKQSQS